MSASIDAYSATLASAPFGELQLAGENRDVRRSFDDFAHAADPATRKAAFLRRGEAFRAAGDAFGRNLLGVARESLASARTHGFRDAMEATYFDLYLDPAQVEEVLKAFMSKADLALRFERANIAYIARTTGLAKVETWDLEAPSASLPTPRFTITEAADVLREAMAPFGKRYTAQLDYVLDPRNGTLDLVPGHDRSPGALTFGAFGHDPVFMMEGYAGYANDVVTLGHELGHAVHFRFMADSKLEPDDRDGIRFLIEGAAKVNELLVLGALERRAKTPAEKTFFLRQLCSTLAAVRFATMYWAVLSSQFELIVNKGVASGTLTEPSQVNAVWMEQASKLAERYKDDPNDAYLWANTVNFFKWPRTYVSYLFAWLIGVAVYERIDADPAFGDRWVEFLRAGFPEEPVKQLRDRLGIDLGAPATVDRALALVERRVRELEAALR